MNKVLSIGIVLLFILNIIQCGYNNVKMHEKDNELSDMTELWIKSRDSGFDTWNQAHEMKARIMNDIEIVVVDNDANAVITKNDSITGRLKIPTVLSTRNFKLGDRFKLYKVN